MAHNSADEDPNGIKSNSSLEFNSEDDNFDDFLDDELNPMPMTDDRFINNNFNSNIPDFKQSNTNIINQNRQNPSISTSRFQKPYNIENPNDSAYIEPISKSNANSNVVNVAPETSTSNTGISALNNNINVSQVSSGGLKLLNRSLINKSNQSSNVNNANTSVVQGNMNNNESSSINFSNKSEISFPPLPSQNSLNLQQQQQQQQPNIPLRGLGARLLLNTENNNNANNISNVNSGQSIPGIPVVESGSGNFNSSLQSSLFTKNENGSTIINFPPLKGENEKTGSQFASNSMASANPPQTSTSKMINFPPLKSGEQNNQSINPSIQQSQNEQKKDVQDSMQLPNISGLDQSQTQQPSQIRVSIKPKFLLKQTPQSTGKPQVSFNPNQHKSQNIPINQNQEKYQAGQQNQIQSQTIQDQSQNLPQFQSNQIQNQIQNFQQSQVQNPPQNQNFQQSQQTQNQDLQQQNQNVQTFPISSSQNQYSSQPFQNRIQSNYIMTPTDRVAISFENKLNLSLSALKRSISSELSSSLRLPRNSTSTTVLSTTEPSQDVSRFSFTKDSYTFAGRLPSSFDTDVDSFLDNLNNELINAVSFAPLLGTTDGSFATSIYANNISPAASVNSTEVMSVNNNNLGQNDPNKMNKNSFLNMSVNMSFAAERHVAFLAQSIGNSIDENLRPITSGLAASSIVEKQIYNEQMKSLQKLNNEVSSLRSLFKSGASQIFEKLNQKVALFELNEQEDAKRRRKFNRSLNELRYKRKDLEIQLQKQIEEKDKNDAALRNLVEKRKKNFMENFSKNGVDMKLNRLLKIIENIENELRDDTAILGSSSSNRNMNYSVIPSDSNYLNSLDSPKMFGDLINTLKNGETILNMNDESMRMHLIDLTNSNRWIASSLSAMPKFIQKENVSNSNIGIGSRSQLQLQYSPNRNLMSPRRGNMQNSFV